jgi:hypothetical protein
MTRWTDTTAARILAGLTYTPRHRAPSVRVDESRILTLYVDDFARHMLDDGRTVDEALTLAEMDASDRMTIVEAAS